MLGEPDYTEKTKKLSNDELLEQLDYCGHDPYYRKLYTTTVNEIRERLKHCNQVGENV